MKIAIIVTNNTEDIEAIVPYDVWQRAGLNPQYISVLNSTTIKCANQTTIVANNILDKTNLNEFDGIYFPGGMGVYTINNANLLNFVKSNFNKKIILSLCAATDHLVKKKLIPLDYKATGYPGTTDSFKNQYVDNDIVEDRNFISGQGPGCAFKLAFALVKKILGPAKAQQLAKSMIYKTD